MQPALSPPEVTTSGSVTATGITASEFRQIANYNPETGDFVWLADRSRAKAGTSAPRGNTRYVEYRINGKLYLAHRLAWLWVHGQFPAAYIDHINGDEKDNRIANLRPATHQQNLCNRGANKNNTTGYKGVYFLGPGKYKASIKENGKSKHLGIFDNPVAAHQAYSAAAHRLHGKFARVV